MQMMRGVGKTDSVKDGINAAGGSAGGAKIADVGIEDLSVLQAAEHVLELLTRSADHTERNLPAVEFGRNVRADRASGSENRCLFHTDC
jgi:hypothetical protein